MLTHPKKHSCSSTKINLASIYESYHLNRLLSQVSLCNKLLTVSNIEPTLCQGLDDCVMAQKRLGGVTLKNKATGPTVQVSRKQKVHYWRLHMLLVILIGVERFLKFFWDIFCKTAKIGKSEIYF